MRVPDVLLSGHHLKVAEWREREALERTRRRRPDLLSDNEGTRTPPSGERIDPDLNGF
jgi:tRNA (guanine-N1)-methyltransferase